MFSNVFIKFLYSMFLIRHGFYTIWFYTFLYMYIYFISLLFYCIHLRVVPKCIMEKIKVISFLAPQACPVPNDQLNISVKFHENQMIFRGSSQNALFSPREQVKIERKYDKCRLFILHIKLGHIIIMFTS